MTAGRTCGTHCLRPSPSSPLPLEVHNTVALADTRSNRQKSEYYLRHDLCTRLNAGAYVSALAHDSRLSSRLAHRGTTVYELRADALYNISSMCASACAARLGTFGSGTLLGACSVTDLARPDCALVARGLLSALPTLMRCICMDPAHASLSLRARVRDDGHCDPNMLTSPSCTIQRSDVCAPESQYGLCFDDSYVQFDSHSVQQVASKSEASVLDYARVNHQDLPPAFKCNIMLVDEPGNDSDTGIIAVCT
jgi:hypothetical protein